MTVKTTNAQLGLSVTPANNFTLDASADDGTMKLERNDGQDIMTVDVAGKVGFPQNAQTWQDVKTTPGRAFNTDYTNSTGQPIQVNVVCAIENGDGAALIVSSLVVGYCAGYGGLTGGMYQSMSALVPNGAVYRINSTATPTLNSWMELR